MGIVPEDVKSMILNIPIDLNIKIRKRCLEYPYCNKTEFILAVLEEFIEKEEREEQ
jgi:hypothetical protein